MSRAPTKATFITFYSFKGGVGRSMALINTAAMLAGRGLGVVKQGFRVLVLDLDLEAPGLSYLVNAEADSSQPGFVDLLIDAKERGVEADLFALPTEEIARRYTRPYRFPDDPEGPAEGTLDIMPAGRFDGEYTRRFDTLNLHQLYQDGLGEPLIRVFKTKFAEAGLYDYVLVDSRTGFSDEAGICTRDLADFLIIFSGLNRQNVEGTCNFLRAFREATEGQYERRKPIRIVLSPVPNGEDDLLDRREQEAKAAFEKAWGTDVDLSLQIPYHPKLALTEEPHISRRRRGALFEAYRGITRHVLSAIGHDVPTLTRSITDTLRKKDYTAALFPIETLVRMEEGPRAVGEIVRELVTWDTQPRQDDAEAKNGEQPDNLERISRDASGLLVLGHLIDHIIIDGFGRCSSFFLERLEGPLNDKVDAFFDRLPHDTALTATILGRHAVALEMRLKKPDKANVYYLRAVAADPEHANNLGNYADFLEKRGELEAARAYYERAVDANPEHADHLGNYANFLQRRGELEAARAYYVRAVDADPEHADHLGNYAVFLEKRGELEAARAYYVRAVDADPEHADHLGNYAVFLEKRGELEAARAYYVRAIDADPEHANNLGNYALFLDERGELEAARAYYERAVDADPEHANNLGNYGQFLVGSSLYEQGEKLLLAAASLLDNSNLLALTEICFSLYVVTRIQRREAGRWLRGFKFGLQRGFERSPWSFEAMLRQAEPILQPAEFAYVRAMAAAFLDEARVGDLDSFPSWRELEPLDPTAENSSSQADPETATAT